MRGSNGPETVTGVGCVVLRCSGAMGSEGIRENLSSTV